MTEMLYFRPHSLTVTAPSNPSPAPPMQCVDLGLLLTDCQETVCDPVKNTANFVSIFESQTVSRQSAQVPSQHCIESEDSEEEITSVSFEGDTASKIYPVLDIISCLVVNKLQSFHSTVCCSALHTSFRDYFCLSDVVAPKRAVFSYLYVQCNVESAFDRAGRGSSLKSCF